MKSALGRLGGRLVMAVSLASCEGAVLQGPVGPGGRDLTPGAGAVDTVGDGRDKGLDACAAEPLAPPRIWRLTKSQLANSLRDQFGFEPPSMQNLPSDTRLDGFANQASE